MKILLTVLSTMFILNAFGQTGFIDHPRVEYIFAHMHEVEPLKDDSFGKILKTKITSKMVSPENYIGQKLILDVIKGNLQAYKVNRKGTPPPYFDSNYDVEYFPPYDKEKAINPEELKAFLMAADTSCVPLLEGEPRDTDLMSCFGQYGKVVKYNRYFFHPKLQKLVSYAVGVELKLKNQEQKDDGGFKFYRGESLYIPLPTPSLKDYKKISVHKSQVFWVAQTSHYLRFMEKTAHVSFLKGNQTDFRKETIVQPSLKGEKEIYQNIDDAVENTNKQNLDYLDAQLATVSRDTIVTFDPDTYEERIKVIANGPPPFEDIKTYKMYEKQYFIDNKKLLISIVEYTSPMILPYIDEKYPRNIIIKY